VTFASALSEHPVAADAVGEVLGHVVEAGGVEPDLVAVFASAAHAEFLGEISAAVRTVLRPRSLVGSAASGVLAGGREVEDAPALAVWASWTGSVEPLRLTARRVAGREVVDGGADDGPGSDSLAIDGVPAHLPDGATLLLLADPFSLPVDGLAEHLARARPDVTVVGGLASASTSPGGNVLLLGEDLHRDGAVGAVVPREQLVGPVVSQGCRPVGDPMVVTGSDGGFLLELAGRPALEQLTALVEALPAGDRTLLSTGVHLGVAIDEGPDRLDTGDFLVRSVLGADRDHGVLAVGDRVPVGTTVQFHVRDAAAADDDLRRSLRGIRGEAALLFTCNGRGRDLFGAESHDASALAEHLSTDSVAGMFCAGELGPVGGRSFLHSFTASMLIFAAG
jgi:small ligand-binding sensory domain FIST